MLNWIKRITITVCICCMLGFGTGCNITEADDYHASNDKAWITEQVQKGHLTQKEADEIIARQEALKNKK